MKKILIDKINITFLRNSDFSNVNNLFSTRYVRNVENINSTTPFIIITDKDGLIKYSGPVKKIEKIK